MSISDRLDEIQARYRDWHNGYKEDEDPSNWRQRDPGESMEHCIVRNDIPALLAAFRTMLDGCDEQVEVEVGHTLEWFYNVP